jgi:hypothetical protein
LPVTKKPVRAIFHHTAGHSLAGHSGESYAEAVAYVKAIQNYHMDSNGWIDTGQNFTVTRNGYIFEGRHNSFARVAGGQMVVSAHCPNFNDQPGVEIEHVDPETMTPIQRAAAVWLFAWIAGAAPSRQPTSTATVTTSQRPARARSTRACRSFGLTWPRR